MADRWFVRCDAGGVVIQGFTDDFEKPQAGDTEITDPDAGRIGRHFSLSLRDTEERPLFKVVNGVLVARTADEINDAAYLEKRKRRAIRATKEACNTAISDQWGAVEMIGRLMLAIDRLLTATNTTAPAKYANMKATIEPLTTARDTRIDQIKACTTLAQLEALLNA